VCKGELLAYSFVELGADNDIHSVLASMQARAQSLLLHRSPMKTLSRIASRQRGGQVWRGVAAPHSCATASPASHEAGTTDGRGVRGPRVAMVNQPQDAIVAADEQHGSVAIVNWELAKRLASRYDVVVYAPRQPGQLPTERWNSIEIRRIPFVAQKLHKGIQLVAGQLRFAHPYFASPFYFREYFTQLSQDLQRSPVHIVHLPQQLQFASMIHDAVPGVKIVLHMHQDELALLEYEPLRKRLVYIDSVVTVSDWVTQRARARFPELAWRMHTIGNGVDIDRFHPASTRAPPGRPMRLLFVGRISPDKGVHLLMEAFDRFARERQDVALDLVGKPGMLPYDLLGLLLRGDSELLALGEFYGKSRLQGLIAASRGQRGVYQKALTARLSPLTIDRVRFQGTISFEELLRLYQQADLLVLPSIWNESYGMPVAEAMACGVPVLASHCGGVPELIEDGVSGQLTARGDVDSLVNGLRRLLDDPARLREMGRAARKRAELLTWEHSAERLGRVYEGLLADTQARASAMPRCADAFTTST
jgi:glycosyltransferase involved in cell wall biosynthesis